MRKLKTDQRWKTVGEISVDAGMAMICDPCYLTRDAGQPHPVHGDWAEFCNAMGESHFMELPLGHGVVVRTGYGDGSYPVQVRINKEGRVAEMRVLFIDQEDDEAE
jgi:hypothetical protein